MCIFKRKLLIVECILFQALDRLDEVDRDAAQIPPLPDITDSETGEV